MGAACSTCSAGTDGIVARPLVEPTIFSAAEAEQHLDARAPGEWVLRNPPPPAENQTTTVRSLVLIPVNAENRQRWPAWPEGKRSWHDALR